MKTRWLDGLDAQNKSDITQAFKESALIRRRLKLLLEEEIETKRKSQVAKFNYDNPNWAYLQADFSGYERALRDVISWIDE